MNALLLITVLAAPLDQRAADANAKATIALALAIAVPPDFPTPVPPAPTPVPVPPAAPVIIYPVQPTFYSQPIFRGSFGGGGFFAGGGNCGPSG